MKGDVLDGSYTVSSREKALQTSKTERREGEIDAT